jgi:hypothetical protein
MVARMQPEVVASHMLAEQGIIFGSRSSDDYAMGAGLEL